MTSPKRLTGLIFRMGIISIAGVVLGLASRSSSSLTLSEAINNLDDARRQWIEESGQNLSQYIALFLYIPFIPLIAITISHWSSLRWRFRFPALAVISFYLIESIQGGSRHGIFCIIVIVYTCAIGASLGGRLRLRLRTVVLSLAGATFLFALYSSLVALQRVYSKTDNYAEFVKRQNEFPVDPNHYAFDLAPAIIAPSILSGFQYFGHGYEGLAVCLEKPFIGSGFGTGHSRVLNRNLARALHNDEIYKLSYFDRLIIEDHFSESFWITIYPWIASDLTFPGSVIFMGLMAWMFATAWRDTLIGTNLYSPAVLAWLSFTICSTSVIFPPGDYGSLVSYWGSIGLWLWTRRRSRFRSKVFTQRSLYAQS